MAGEETVGSLLAGTAGASLEGIGAAVEGKTTSGTKGAAATGLVDEIPPATNVADGLSPVVVDNSAPVVVEDKSTAVVVKIESALAVDRMGSTTDGFTTGGAGAGVRAAGGVDAVELTDGLGDLATIGIGVDFTGVKGGGAITDCALSPQIGVGVWADVIEDVGEKADKVLAIVGLVVDVVVGSKVAGAVGDRSEGVEITAAGITDVVAEWVTSRETPCVLEEGTGPERAGIVGAATNFAVKSDDDPFTFGVAPRGFTGIPVVELPSTLPDCA